MNNKKKIIISLILVISTIIIFSNCTVWAAGVLDDPDTYKPTDGGNDPTAVAMAGKVIGVLKTIGSIVSVGALMLIGIGYMTSSAEGKADYKKTMIPYIVGCILIFAGSQLVQIIYDFANGM